MRISRLILVALVVPAVFVPSACGGDDETDDGTPTTAVANGTEENGTEENDVADDVADDVTESEPSADVPTSGVSFEEVLMGDADLPEITELITAIQVLGSDREGYVADRTIVATATDDSDLGYLCVASDQLSLDTYSVVVLDVDGSPADC